MYVRIEVYPGAKRELVKQIGEDRFEILLKEPAERNLANQRARALIAEIYKVNLKQVRIISGHHSSRKIFSVADSLSG